MNSSASLLAAKANAVVVLRTPVLVELLICHAMKMAASLGMIGWRATLAPAVSGGEAASSSIQWLESSSGGGGGGAGGSTQMCGRIGRLAFGQHTCR
jgi:hypothetical protein